ncbi:MAG: hypothetical protein V4466_05770 [Pseudomonadota bacterium]
MPLENLPQSTTDIAIDALIRKVDVGHASAWAMDLVALGHLDSDTVELAGLDGADRPRAEVLLPAIAARIGLDLDNRPVLLRWIERHFLKNYLGGVLSEMDLIDCGAAVWARLDAADGTMTNPFHIYNDLGELIATETGGRDLDSLDRPNHRAWVLNHLAADGAFDRAGLELPV